MSLTSATLNLIAAALPTLHEGGNVNIGYTPAHDSIDEGYFTVYLHGAFGCVGASRPTLQEAWDAAQRDIVRQSVEVAL